VNVDSLGRKCRDMAVVVSAGCLLWMFGVLFADRDVLCLLRVQTACL